MEAARSLNSLNTPLETGSVVFQVIERIKEALINKELMPGDFLPSETELARNLAVGKSSVREAVKMLQAMGVVEVLRGQGTLIREHPGNDLINSLIFQLILGTGQIRDLLDLRLMFEPACAVMAMERASDADMERVGQAVDRLERAIAAGTQRADDDLALHLAILHCTRNPYVIRIGETIYSLFRPSISTSMRTIPEVALRDHRNIHEAFRSRDEARLRKAVVGSFEGWRKSLDKGPTGTGRTDT